MCPSQGSNTRRCHTNNTHAPLTLTLTWCLVGAAGAARRAVRAHALAGSGAHLVATRVCGGQGSGSGHCMYQHPKTRTPNPELNHLAPFPHNPKTQTRLLHTTTVTRVLGMGSGGGRTSNTQPKPPNPTLTSLGPKPNPGKITQ